MKEEGYNKSSPHTFVMTEPGSGRPKVFVREATGLVREVNARSSFVAQWMLVTGGYPIFLLTYLGTFPGANFFLALVIGFLPMFALLSVYTLFSISMPRAGGDYVYVTRGFNSFVGFVSSFALAAAYMVSNGVFVVFAGTYIGYHFSALGIVDHNTDLLTLGSTIVTPNNAFILALIISSISLGIAIVRPAYAWRMIFWAGLVGIVSTVMMFGILATINQSAFQASYDSFITTNNASLVANGFANATTYSQTISAGGFAWPSSVLVATMAAFPISLYSYAWAQLPANWAGEIKHVQKSMPLILLGGMLWCAVYYLLLLQLSINAFGQPFLTSWSALSYNPAYPLRVTLSDYIPFFAYLVYHNPIVPWVMFLALFVPALFSFPPLLMACVRYLFAFSFDRLLPAKICSVNERTHTPIIATFIAFIASMLGSVIQTFYPSATPSVLVPIILFGYLLPALAGIAFPYLKKDLYERSFIVKKKVAGIPVLTWTGLASAIGLLVGIYSIFASGLYAFTLPDYIFYGLAYGLGIVIFVIAYFARKGSGIDISLAFKQIPPE